MAKRVAPMRWVVAFGQFWFDFLIGDTPELFVGGVVAVGAGATVVAVGDRGAAVVVLPLLVLVVLGLSLVRALPKR